MHMHMHVAGVLLLLALTAAVPLLAAGAGALLEVVSRAAWGAKPPLEGIDTLETPVKIIVIHSTNTASGFTKKDCAEMTRVIQDYHMDGRHWFDIGYNYLVCEDGRAYEGRGWGQVGAHTLSWNAKSVGIALVGRFADRLPTAAQITALRELIQEGVEHGAVDAEYELVAACQLRPYDSPGLRLYEELQSWPHWWKYSAPKAWPPCSVDVDDTGEIMNQLR